MFVLDELQDGALRACYRFAIGEPQLFERLPIFQAAGSSAKSVLFELEQHHGLIRQTSLWPNRTCYELTERFSEHFESDKLVQKPLTSGEKKRALAMLELCLCDTSTARRPLTALDFQLPQFESIVSEFPPNTRFRDYYLTSRPEGLTIGLLRVDGGAEHRWERLLQKLKRDFLKPVHQSLINRQDPGLEFSVATPFAKKAEALRNSVYQHTMFDGFPVHTYSFPDLAAFRSN